MSLAIGTRLGPYQIESLLGVGGMGEVYRANDTRLDRDVAVKVLPAGITDDAAQRARFHREAKVISALSHAHICALYDVGHDAGVEYLVLELLQGETLAARLARGALPISQVVRLGNQMADALAAAHRHGIVHRDLKPANIMLTPTGVKLLDFGLAKPLPLPNPPPLAATVVGDAPPTAEGSIVGTLQYMAPEQVQGLAADARTDIFALGAVLHEMVTGRRAFGGPSQAHLIASILNADPPPITKLAPLAPPALEQLIDRCLAKDPADRWQSAHDVMLQLEWLQSHMSGAEATGLMPPSRRRRWALPLAAAAAGAVLTAAPLLLVRPSAPSAGSVPMRLDVVLPENTRLETEFGVDVPEISPDGRWLAYSAWVEGRRQLLLRNLGSHEAKVLAGGEGANRPFWSPDSRSIGFFANDSLKRISLAGGTAQVLAPAPQAGGGGAWKAGLILYSALGLESGRLHSIPDTGGKPALVETLPRGPGTGFDIAPRFLPDGTSFLVEVWREDGVYVGSLETSGRRRLLENGARARYTQGFLLFLQGSRLFARPFDPARQEFLGPEELVTEPARVVSASQDGTVVYHGIPPRPASLAWYTRLGVRQDTLADAGHYLGMTLAPSGRRAAVWKPDAVGNVDIWDVDLSSGILSRMTTDPSGDSDAAWSPDSSRMAFSSNRTGRSAVYLKDIASGREELISQPDGLNSVVDGWTPDGRSLVVRTTPTARATYLVSVDGERTARLLGENPFVKDEHEVSPDGRWVAFNSNESGEWEVYVATFPAHTSKRRVSSAGGVQPHWRGDGRELFYLARDSSIMSVPVAPGPGLETGRPVALFSIDIEPNPNLPQYGVTRDGQRFLGLSRGQRDREQLTMLLNWMTPAHLARR